MKKFFNFTIFGLMLFAFAACTPKHDPSLTNPTPATQVSVDADIPTSSAHTNAELDNNDPGLTDRGDISLDEYPEDYFGNIPAEDIIVTVHFGFDKYALDAGERTKAMKAVNALKTDENLKVALVARTDFRGTVEYNIGLSDKRGTAVMTYMAAHDIDTLRTEVVALGKKYATPNVAKDSAEAKADRRVDIIRLKLPNK